MTTAAARTAEVVDDDRQGAGEDHVPASIQRFADDDIVPRMQIPVAEAKARLAELREFVKEVMVENIHYGPPFPGSDKLVLYKAGGELLMEVYGYAVDVSIANKIEQWTAAEGGPFFHYQVEARIYSKRSGNFVGRGIGSCNSRENRYRWRTGQRLCPACGSESIIKGREEYGGGWLCFAKKGGCGAKFKGNAAEITDQQVGKVPNDDVETLVNTILKIAKKRAYLDGAITVTQSSGLFAIEDDSDDADEESQPRQRAGAQASKGQASRQQAKKDAPPTQSKGEEKPPDDAHPNKVVVRDKVYWTAGISAEKLLRCWDLSRQLDKTFGKNTAKDSMREVIGVDSTVDLNNEMADKFIAHLVDQLGGDSDDSFTEY